MEVSQGFLLSQSTYRRFPSQFKSDLFQVRLGRSFQDGSAGGGRASKGQFIDIHVIRDGIAGRLAVTRDQVHDSLGEASLLNVLASLERREGCSFSRLDHHGVSGGQSGSNLPFEIVSDMTSSRNGIQRTR